MPTLRVYNFKYNRINGRQTLFYHTIDSEVAKFKRVADKTSVQRLSIMFAASFHGNNEAKLGIIWLLQPKNHPKKEKRMVFAVFQMLLPT